MQKFPATILMQCSTPLAQWPLCLHCWFNIHNDDRVFPSQRLMHSVGVVWAGLDTTLIDSLSKSKLHKIPVQYLHVIAVHSIEKFHNYSFRLHVCNMDVVLSIAWNQGVKDDTPLTVGDKHIGRGTVV